ncbi:hypothetical protein GLW36_11975 [Halorubrum terrestre]|uniref:Uncharacterized protein n=1 Tax=Halorubrum distributum TaxID=29283 RepID=A0A6B1IQP0_9EURY|nr:hypothetical protein [Halorubrum terrestre]MYL17355.1 hypothetical protein [Halorubrum terrestre]
MNEDDVGVTTAETSEQMSLGGEKSEIDSTEDGWELCELLLDSNDLRRLGIPQGTQAVVFRVEGGVILVSTAH